MYAFNKTTKRAQISHFGVRIIPRNIKGYAQHNLTSRAQVGDIA